MNAPVGILSEGRRRFPRLSFPGEYISMDRSPENRGIEACLAVNPLGSVDLRDSSCTAPQRLDATYGSPSTSFWNDKWRSVDDDNYSANRLNPTETRQTNSPMKRVSNDEPELAFYPPRKWGERNINLSIYWYYPFVKAIVTFAASHCLLLLLYRVTAIIFLISGNSSLFWTVPYFLAILISSFSHCSIYLNDYVKSTPQMNTRFQAFLELFTWSSFVDLMKFSAGGSLMSWVFAAQLGTYYQGPILFTGDLNKPEQHTKFLNEEDFYVILSGAWFGSLIFFQRHFDFTRPKIKFPVIQRMKILDFKAKARPTLKKSFKKSVWPALTFTFVYHFFLGGLKDQVVYFSLFLDSCTLEIDRTWYQFFNVRRFVVIYLSGVLTWFSFRMAKIIVRIFLLAPKDFNVELFHEDQSELTLSEAIADRRLPLVKALAFSYLLKISQDNTRGQDRRRKIYSLNPTGDTPAEWQAIKSDCLSVIEKFSSEVDEFRFLAENHRYKWSDAVPVLPRHLALQAMRLKLQREQLIEQKRAMNILERLKFESKRLVVQIPWLMYVFDCEKENAFLKATRGCHDVLFAVRSLSCLVSHSVVEDTYGVVQQDISYIVNALTVLKEKLWALKRVSQQCSGYSVYIQRSIVRIWLAFPDSFGSEGLKQFR